MSNNEPSGYDGNILSFLKELFGPEQAKATIAVLYVCFAATLWKYLAVSPDWCEYLEMRYSTGASPLMTDFLLGTYKMLGAFCLFALIPGLIVKLLFRERLSDYGLCPGNLQAGAFSFLIMAPIIIVIAYMTGQQEEYLRVYPLNPAVKTESLPVWMFALHSMTYVLCYYLGWEFLFRGFLQNALAHRIGALNAILVQTLASTMLHYGNPEAEVLAAILAGLFWGFVSMKTRSILSGLGQHALLGVVLDWFLIYGKR